MPAYPTPHINATPADFAETVLMPGDPLRSRFIAQNFLENARLVNDVRGVQGYTGSYKGTPVSVMASGMGMPSIGIYSHELYHVFGVQNILRVGSAGALREDVDIGDIVIGLGSHSFSGFNAQLDVKGTFAPTASYSLVEACVAAARENGIKHRVGMLYSTDVFYDEGEGLKWAALGALAVEMESAALYLNAAKAGKNALCICTVSDHLVKEEHLSAEERETTFTDMMTLALETAVRIAG